MAGQRRRWGGGTTAKYWEEETRRPAEPGWLVPGMASLLFLPISGKSPETLIPQPEGTSLFASSRILARMCGLDCLQSEKSPKEFGDELVAEGDQYNGFNLVVADLSSMTMAYITNRPKDNGLSVTQVSPGIHVLSNANLDTPWPKAMRLRCSFEDAVEKYFRGEISSKGMTESIMKDTTKDDESKLPGIYTPDYEYPASAIFVETTTPLGQYGTRSISAVTLKHDQEVCFYETSLEKGVWQEHTVCYCIEIEEIAS